MKHILLSVFVAVSAVNVPVLAAGTSDNAMDQETTDLAIRNLERSMDLVDGVMNKCFTGTTTVIMRDVYNFSTGRHEDGISDVWPYTAVIEAVNSVLEGMEALKGVAPEIYELEHERYVNLLNDLHKSIGYYRGSFTLTSYTRTTNWRGIYGVHRGPLPGMAAVEGIENVYDDQMWLVREYIRAYKNTGDNAYLKEAEHLTEYILDGWDACLDRSGNEYGGITWGPGYTSKHACSNSPIISPLVWLAEIYKGKDDMTTRYFVNPDQTRGTEQVNKHDYYLDFAKRVYDWQKKTLFDKNTGCYHDMCGGVTGTISYEEIDGEKYRKHVGLGGPGGTQFTYNTGTMLCGAVDLYRVTGEQYYLDELKQLSKSSYNHFRGTRVTIDGTVFFQFPYDKNTLEGFNAWFDDVLLRAYVDAVPYADDQNALGKPDNFSKRGCDNFQQNLDYAYDNFLLDGFLPNNLLKGWEDNTKTKAFHQVAYASEYAKLIQYYVKSSETAGIGNFNVETADKKVDVYSIDGRRVRSNVSKDTSLDGLRPGVYIAGGEKYIVR